VFHRETQKEQLPKVTVILTSQITRNVVTVTRKNWRRGGLCSLGKRLGRDYCDTLVHISDNSQLNQVVKTTAKTAKSKLNEDESPGLATLKIHLF
jgi:hypothetical protein